MMWSPGSHIETYAQAGLLTRVASYGEIAVRTGVPALFRRVQTRSGRIVEWRRLRKRIKANKLWKL